MFHTKKIGKIPKAQSVTALIAACAYVTLARIGPLKHLPVPSTYFVHKKLIGVH